MITVKNVQNLEGFTTHISIESIQDFTFDAQGTLTLLPALIDPFARLSDPAESYLKGGITSLLTSCPTFKEMDQTKAQFAHFPLHLSFYLGDDAIDPTEIGKAKEQIVGLWIDAENLRFDSESKSRLDRLFQVAAQDALIVTVKLGAAKNRLKAMETLLSFVEKYNAEIAFADLFQSEELTIIRQAKQKELMIYGGASLKSLEAVLEGIHEGIIDMVGAEDSLSLPHLLNSYHERKLSLEKIVSLTRRSIEEIFHLKQNSDLVLVNLEKSQKAAGKQLVGWPVYTIASGQLFRY